MRQFWAWTLIVFLSWVTAPAIYAVTDIQEYLDDGEPKLISMDFKQATMNDVLKVLSQQSGLNFIASSNIANITVNIYLDHVSVDEALERILSANNLTYEIKPGSKVFVVQPLEVSAQKPITRVYHLKYATVVSSKLNKTLSASAAGGSGFGGSGASESGIVAAVKSLITKAGSVIEDHRTNSLIVTDIPGQFPVIEETIARLDVQIPQILIEVEMLDISKSTADLLGAKFGETPATFVGAERDSIYPFDRNKAMNKGFELEEEYRVSTLSFQGLTIALQFLRTQSDTKNLARPRILTLNNETAEISIKTDEAIGLASVTTASQGSSVSVAQAERVETGVFLRVTPQANINNGEITMAIEPRVIQARTGQTFGSSTFKDPEERGTKSILRIYDGDTAMLGGLLRTNAEETRTGLPFLGRIPIVGAAFRHKDKTESQRELIIFITPHIVDEESVSGKPLAGFDKMVREQNVPSQRLKIINDELSHIEGRKF